MRLTVLAVETVIPTDLDLTPICVDCVAMASIIDLGDDPQTQLLMSAYRDASRAAQKEDKESDGWVCRIAEIDGLETDELSVAHGTAIAADLIEIRVEDAVSGLRYRPRRAA